MSYFWHDGKFLHEEVYKTIPPEAISITDEEHTALMMAATNGCMIVSGDDGHPKAVAPPSLPYNPGSNYMEIQGQWRRIRFTRKEFMLFVGVPQIAKLNAAIAGGNALAKTVHDLLMAAEFIDVTDPASVHMLGLLVLPDGGSVLTEADVARIMAGESYDK